jgi:hypothetical protein
MNWQASLARVVRGLKSEEARLERELDDVRAKISALGGVVGRKLQSAKGKVRRKLSPKARAAISRAAKKRWAKYRAEKGSAS